MIRVWAAVPVLLLTSSVVMALNQQPAAVQTSTLKVGDSAPDFTLPDQDGKPVRLASFIGKQRVVLAFYIKAFTSG